METKAGRRRQGGEVALGTERPSGAAAKAGAPRLGNRRAVATLPGNAHVTRSGLRPTWTLAVSVSVTSGVFVPFLGSGRMPFPWQR